MTRLFHVLRAAWMQSIRPATNGERLVIVRHDLVGLRGYIFNPSPMPDGKWSVLIDDEYDGRPEFDSKFQELYRWEFVMTAEPRGRCLMRKDVIA